MHDSAGTPPRHRPEAGGVVVSWPSADASAVAGWSHRHLLDVDQLTLAELEQCLDLAVEMRERRARREALDLLNGEVVGLAFAEASTRTRVSFELAAKALGADVVDLPMAASSATKGESLVDTLRTLELTGISTIVLRHSMSGAPYLAARSTGARIVNAGDGSHAHPTQALVDALTLREALGPLDGKKIAIVGDIALVILAFAGIANLRIRAAYPACLIVTLLTGVLGVSYVWHFMIDSTARSTRIIAAERVQKLGPAEISLAAEPAPYAMPPVDLFRTRLVLHGASADLSMRTVDQIGTSPGAEYWFRPRVLPTPISWAHKPFEVRINKRATVPSAR